MVARSVKKLLGYTHLSIVERGECTMSLMVASENPDLLPLVKL